MYRSVAALALLGGCLSTGYAHAQLDETIVLYRPRGHSVLERIQAARVLAVRGGRAAETALIGCVASDPADTVRVQCVRALERVGTERCVATLTAASRTRSAEVRTAADAALVALRHRLPAAPGYHGDPGIVVEPRPPAR